MIKKCTGCKINDRKNNGKDRYCLKCHSEYMKKWRKTHPLDEEQKKKDTARSYVYQYLKRGKIKKENCIACGNDAQMHHEDYSKPLNVVWLCRSCHMAYHTYKNYFK